MSNYQHQKVQLSEKQQQYIRDNYCRMFPSIMARNLMVSETKVMGFMIVNELPFKQPRKKQVYKKPAKVQEGFFDYNDKKNFAY